MVAPGFSVVLKSTFSFKARTWAANTPALLVDGFRRSWFKAPGVPPDGRKAWMAELEVSLIE